MAVMIVDVPLSEWLPDRPDYSNVGLETALNVFAIDGGYRPILSKKAVRFYEKGENGNPPTDFNITGKILGIKRFDLQNEEPVVVFATSDNCLCMLYNGKIRKTDIKPAGQEYRSGKVSFEVFNNAIYAMTQAKPEALWVYDITKISFEDTQWKQAETGGEGDKAFDRRAPNAMHMAEFEDFLMIGNITEGENKYPTRVQWSAFNNAEQEWRTDSNKQSGYNDLKSKYGAITGIVSTDLPLVFQETAVHVVSYAPTIVARFSLISVDRGCIAPDSIVSVGKDVFFLSHDGFCVASGGSVSDISANKVWVYFQRQIGKNLDKQVQGAHDANSKSIVWNYTTKGKQRAQIIYNYSLNRWTHADVDADVFFEGIPKSLTELDTDFAADPDPIRAEELDKWMNTPGLDSWDSARFGSGVQRVLSCYKNPSENTGEGQWSNMDGETMRAEFGTGDFTVASFLSQGVQDRIASGTKSLVSEIRPHVSTVNPLIEAQVGGRDSSGVKRRFTDFIAQGTQGFCPVRIEARYISVNIVIPAGNDWVDATAFSVSFQPTGVA